MSNVLVKTVDFLGDNLVAVKDESTGKIYAGVSYVCKGIGFTVGQKNRQVSNLKEDLVLKRGCIKFDAGVIDPNNEVLAIELDFLPLWLAKISITPKIQEEQPEVTEKLINYQLKAKDVLAEVFIQSKPTCIEDVLISSLQEMKAIKGEVQAIKVESAKQKEELQGIREVVALNSTDWKADSKNLIVKIAHKLGGNQFIQDVYKEIYTNLERRAACQLNIRKTNKQKKMALEGACKSKINAVSNLDIIGEDKKLLECFLAITKELAIKYGV